MGRLETHLALRGQFTLGQQFRLVLEQSTSDAPVQVTLECRTCDVTIERDGKVWKCAECLYEALDLEVELFVKAALKGAKPFCRQFRKRGSRWAWVPWFGTSSPTGR